MEEQFVPYKVGLKLKEKGFNEECIAGYQLQKATLFSDIPHTLNGNVHRNSEGSFTCAPLVQQVIKWLSDVHNIEVEAMRYTYSGGVYKGRCYSWFVDQFDPKYNHELEEDDSHWILNERKSQGYDFKNRIEALQAGIIEALTLI